MTHSLRAIIFDFDGVIADTEPFHLQAFQKVLSKEGVSLTEKEYYKKYLGMDDKECFTTVLSLHGRKLTQKKVSSLIQKKSRHYMTAISKGLSFIPGVVPFVKKASQRYSLAIVSGALRREIAAILKVGGIEKAFSVIVSAEDIRKGKPDPEGFFTALKRLNQRRKPRQPQRTPIHPWECLVVEDSPFGIEAAIQAGMPCLALSTSYPSGDLSRAHIVRKHFVGLTLSSLERAFSPRRSGKGP